MYETSELDELRAQIQRQQQMMGQMQQALEAANGALERAASSPKPPIAEVPPAPDEPQASNGSSPVGRPDNGVIRIQPPSPVVPMVQPVITPVEYLQIPRRSSTPTGSVEAVADADDRPAMSIPAAVNTQESGAGIVRLFRR